WTGPGRVRPGRVRETTPLPHPSHRFRVHLEQSSHSPSSPWGRPIFMSRLFNPRKPGLVSRLLGSVPLECGLSPSRTASMSNGTAPQSRAYRLHERLRFKRLAQQAEAFDDILL